MADSLKKRYLFKLVSSLIGFAISIATQALVPRGLGPKAFGDYAFLTSILTQIVLFFDLGNTSAFFVKVSQRPREIKLVSFYLIFNFVGFALLIAVFAVILCFPSVYNKIFPDQKLTYIVVALIFAISARILQIFTNMADAHGLTVQSEKSLMAQRIVGLGIIAVLYIGSQLNLATYFGYQYFITISLILVLLWVLRNTGILERRNWRLSVAEYREYIIEFYQYSFPLLIGFLFGFASGILDRWLLQFFGGSVQQGYYGLSFQISAVSTIFTGAMSMLIMREFSIAFNNNNREQMTHLFNRYIPLLYSAAAFISCFVAIQSENIVLIMGGASFEGAYLPVLIMCFYPIHQTYGQLSGSVFLATGQTKLYAKLGVLSVLIGVPMVFFLVASEDFLGLGLGASGLAIKMVAIQIVFVNVQLFYNSRLLNLRFLNYVRHQFISVAIMLVVSIGTYFIVGFTGVFVSSAILSFLLSGAIYTSIVALLVIAFPSIAGVTRTDIVHLSNLVLEKRKNLVSF